MRILITDQLLLTNNQPNTYYVLCTQSGCIHLVGNHLHKKYYIISVKTNMTFKNNIISTVILLITEKKLLFYFIYPCTTVDSTLYNCAPPPHNYPGEPDVKASTTDACTVLCLHSD